MTVELPRKRGESDAKYEARKARHEDQAKKMAARDPNIGTALHVRFESMEARIAGIEAKLGLKLRSAVSPAQPAAVQPPAPPPSAPESEEDDEPLDPDVDPNPYEDDSAS